MFVWKGFPGDSLQVAFSEHLENMSHSGGQSSLSPSVRGAQPFQIYSQITNFMVSFSFLGVKVQESLRMRA